MSATAVAVRKSPPMPGLAPDQRMTAIVQNGYGSTDVLELGLVPTPTIADDEVLVRVLAAGVDRGVWHFMTGLPYPIRLVGGLGSPRTQVLGMDMAGMVEAVGSNVTRFRIGDEVFGAGKGSFAQYASAPENKLAHKPMNLRFDQSAAIPTSALTALQAVRNKGRVRLGQKVLIIGASGGVGTFAVQIAKALGAEVTGVCSTSKVDLVRSLGADHVIDYTREDYSEMEQRFDVILDIAGNSSLSRLRGSLTPSGTLVMVGGETDGRWLGGLGRQLRARVMFPFLNQKLGTFIGSVNADDLMVLKELAEAGRVTPAIDRTYVLGEAPQAIRDLEEGRVRGKVSILI